MGTAELDHRLVCFEKNASSLMGKKRSLGSLKERMGKKKGNRTFLILTKKPKNAFFMFTALIPCASYTETKTASPFQVHKGFRVN